MKWHVFWYLSVLCQKLYSSQHLSGNESTWIFLANLPCCPESAHRPNNITNHSQYQIQTPVFFLFFTLSLASSVWGSKWKLVEDASFQDYLAKRITSSLKKFRLSNLVVVNLFIRSIKAKFLRNCTMPGCTHDTYKMPAGLGLLWERKNFNFAVVSQE